MIAPCDAGATQARMRVVADEESLSLAPSDDQVAVCVAHGAVLGGRDCRGAATKRLAGVANPELGVAKAKRSTSKVNALEIAPGRIVDHHIVRPDHREIGVETLYVDATVGADVNGGLHVPNGGALHGDMP